MSLKMAGDETQCEICKLSCSQSCGRCNKVYYCGKHHQKEDWKSHKSNCLPVRINKNDLVGRHLVATRDMKEGEIIFEETPLVSGPNYIKGMAPICLSCYRYIPKVLYTCSHCKWPVCSYQCSVKKEHSLFECKVFQDNNVAPFREPEYWFYDYIIYLRCLLLKHHAQEKFKKLLSLQFIRDDGGGKIEQGPSILKQVVDFIHNRCNCVEFEQDEINQVMGAIAINSFYSDDGIHTDPKYRHATYLTYMGSMPAHNCISNCNWVISDKGTFLLRAAVNIPQGNGLTISYTDPTEGNVVRNIKLLMSKGFECACERCMDRTELDTYFCALVCPECKDKSKIGYIIPYTESDWYCQQCGEKKGLTYVFETCSEVFRMFRNAPQDNSLESIKQLENIIKEKSDVIVHPNHFHIYAIENDILQRISFLMSSERQRVSRKVYEQLAQKLQDLTLKSLARLNVISPGYTRLRGRLYYCLQQARTACYIKQIRDKKLEKIDLIESSTWHQNLKNLLAYRKIAHDILSIEPSSREESFIVKLLSEDSEDLTTLKKYLQG